MVRLQDLDLMDRFLFDEVMEDPEIHQAVLEIIMQEPVRLLDNNQVEKQIQTAPYLKSVRLDVFAVDEKETVYNTEMQKTRKTDLLKRSRFYQSLIDSGLLPSGSVDYNQLKDSCIIMITPFDLFGEGKYQYTFHPKCKEVPELQLEDGTTRIFLNTKGTNPEEVSEELVEFLKYVEKSDDETAAQSNSRLIQKIHERVKEVKTSEEVGVKYMQAWEEKIYEREEGREEGRIEGETINLIRLIQKKYRKGKSLQDIADDLEEEVDVIKPLYQLVKEHPEQTAEEIVEDMRNQTL